MLVDDFLSNSKLYLAKYLYSIISLLYFMSMFSVGNHCSATNHYCVPVQLKCVEFILMK